MENKFSAKALMLCPICKNAYYSELEITIPNNFRDMKEINTAKDNNVRMNKAHFGIVFLWL